MACRGPYLLEGLVLVHVLRSAGLEDGNNESDGKDWCSSVLQDKPRGAHVKEHLDGHAAHALAVPGVLLVLQQVHAILVSAHASHRGAGSTQALTLAAGEGPPASFWLQHTRFL